MPAPFTKEDAAKEIAAVEKALRAGHQPTGDAGHRKGGVFTQNAFRVAADALGVDPWKLSRRVGTPDKPGSYRRKFALEPDWSLYDNRPFAIPKKQLNPASEHGPAFEIVSRPDNKFLFGAAGDLHAGSKYTRWDAREDLYRQFIEAGAQCNFDTGNWIDGEARFNTYDIEAHGLDAQIRLLARQHPKGLPTLAVWGDDHEGWYVQREGIDVGRYAESIMREAGHDWTNLGFMESTIILRNANSGKTQTMAVCHPGGGSSYALSYAIQKIVESLEGGEKPGVGLYGHYHKLWAGNIRNVWCVQTACQQDQTPFMRKKRLEAHVGGALVELEQDPKTGAIIACTPKLIRYFNRDYYAGSGRWSKHGDVRMLTRVGAP